MLSLSRSTIARADLLSRRVPSRQASGEAWDPSVSSILQVCEPPGISNGEEDESREKAPIERRTSREKVSSVEEDQSTENRTQKRGGRVERTERASTPPRPPGADIQALTLVPHPRLHFRAVCCFVLCIQSMC